MFREKFLGSKLDNSATLCDLDHYLEKLCSCWEEAWFGVGTCWYSGIHSNAILYHCLRETTSPLVG